MVIYIDVIIFLNFIINYCFMELIYMLFHEKENKTRIIISSLFSVVLLFSFLLDYMIFNFIKIFGGVILVFIAFKYQNKKRLIISLCLFYILQFSFIGILSIFNIQGCLCLLFLLIICLLFMICFQKKTFNNKYYDVIVKLIDEEIHLKGFLDTGNFANHYNKPIIFLDKKYYNKELIVSDIVNIKTVTGTQFLNCYTPKSFYIIIDNKKQQKDILVAFIDFDNDVNCLLNDLLFN